MAKGLRMGTSKQAEANVLIELRMRGSMSEEVLDANSDDILEAVEAGASDLALGPTVTLNVHENSVGLRFDVLGGDAAEIYKQVAKVLKVVLRNTDLDLRVGRSSVELQNDDAGVASRTQIAAA